MQTLQKSRSLPLSLSSFSSSFLVLCTVNFGCLSLLDAQTPLLSWEIVEFCLRLCFPDSTLRQLYGTFHFFSISQRSHCWVLLFHLFCLDICCFGWESKSGPFCSIFPENKIGFYLLHLTPVPFYLYWSYHLKLFPFILTNFLSLFCIQIWIQWILSVLVYNKMFFFYYFWMLIFLDIIFPLIVAFV